MCHILFFSASQKHMYTLTCTLTFTHISIYFIRTKLVIARVHLRAYIRYIHTYTWTRVTSFKKIEPEQQQKRKHKHNSNQKKEKNEKNVSDVWRIVGVDSSQLFSFQMIYTLKCKTAFMKDWKAGKQIFIYLKNTSVLGWKIGKQIFIYLKTSVFR